MAEEPKDKKIIIDEDWKQKAQQEKDKLKEEEQTETQSQAESREMPPANLTGLVSLLASQAFFALGVMRTEADKDKEIEPDLEMARYHIDLLAMLEEKCKGNMTEEEQRLLGGTLNQLRMIFVQMSK